MASGENVSSRTKCLVPVTTMRIISGTTEFRLDTPSAVMIGKFDGMHIGHQLLLSFLLEEKQNNGLTPVAFTFDPSPEDFFTGVKHRALFTKEEKRAFFEKMGVEVLVEFPMNEETAGMDATVFIKSVLLERLNTKFVAAGDDLSFGKYGAGNAQLLKEVAEPEGCRIRMIPKITCEGEEISSERIRDAVLCGNLPLAAAMLGRPYCIGGRVVHGNGIGRNMGLPTINLFSSDEKLLPPNGVYYSETLIREKLYKSISNVGTKPTVKDDLIVNLETFLFDVDEELYDEDVVVYLHEFRRPEKRFESLEQLKAQIDDDVRAGKEFKTNDFPLL